ncbi:MAG: hypothetical protein C0594_00590 [Marinilabiliales bacterium]|nr:MAG: hypothetical protein C0594_00590 [Marinilabiliales bacterium]
MPGIVLSTAYFPPIHYFACFTHENELLIEAHENFVKQTYRNRCSILAANGPISLIVPVEKETRLKVPIKDVKIAYHEDWQRLHFKTIESAYRSSPFYEYYIDDLMPVFNHKHKYLFDLNTLIIQTISDLLDMDVKCKETANYQKEYSGVVDYRYLIHPKKNRNAFQHFYNKLNYRQVFNEKFGFVESLSILDIIFNEGPQSVSLMIQAQND